MCVCVCVCVCVGLYMSRASVFVCVFVCFTIGDLFLLLRGSGIMPNYVSIYRKSPQ